MLEALRELFVDLELNSSATSIGAFGVAAVAVEVEGMFLACCGFGSLSFDGFAEARFLFFGWHGEKYLGSSV